MKIRCHQLAVYSSRPPLPSSSIFANTGLEENEFVGRSVGGELWRRSEGGSFFFFPPPLLFPQLLRREEEVAEEEEEEEETRKD